MKWLLIVIFLSPSGVPTPFSAPFPTHEACLAGQATVRRSWEPGEYLESWCVQRIEEQETVV